MNNLLLDSEVNGSRTHGHLVESLLKTVKQSSHPGSG